mgnify:FL=1
MKAILTWQDRFCLEQMKQFGLFAEIMPQKLEISNGVIIVPCSDGDQFDDVYGHIAKVCREVQIGRIHTVALNGGGILMSNQLPAEQQRHGDCLLENILTASAIKGIKDIFLYTHFPCAIAMSNGLGVIDQAFYLKMAKTRLKEANLELRIKCFFHVDKYDEQEGGSHKRRTYFMPKEKWESAEVLGLLHAYKNHL